MKMQLYIKNFMWLEFTFQNRRILIQTQLKINQNATKVEIIYTRGVHKKKTFRTCVSHSEFEVPLHL